MQVSTIKKATQSDDYFQPKTWSNILQNLGLIKHTEQITKPNLINCFIQ